MTTDYPLVEYRPDRDPEAPVRLVLWPGSGVDCVEVEWAVRLHERLGVMLDTVLGHGCSRGEVCSGQGRCK